MYYEQWGELLELEIDYLFTISTKNNTTSTAKRDPWEGVNWKVEKLTSDVYSTWSNELTNLLIFVNLHRLSLSVKE